MMYSLPEEVLEHIFSFIASDKDRNAVSLVCKSWYEIERWCRRKVFVGNCYAVSPGIMSRRFPEVRSVELKGKPHFADFNLVPEGWGGYACSWIDEMSRAYPWLEEIRLKRMVVTDESLELISTAFKNFKVLVLHSCEGFSTDGLSAIAANCRNLRELDLRESDVMSLSGHWISHFRETSTSIESLNISCLGSEVSFSALERLVARSPNLKTLRLNRAVPLGKLSTLLHHAPQLVELGTGSYSSGIWSDVYSSLSRAFLGCKELKGLSGFWDVDPSYLPAFYSVCSRLTTLNLSYATVRSPDITKVVSQCPNLQRLWVLDHIEDSGLNALALSCKNLQELRVFPSDPFVADPNVTLTEQGLVSVSQDRVFEYIGIHAKKLDMLSIAFAGDSDLGLHYVLSGCESLKKLEIRDCPFGDTALLANVAKLATMRSLWMSSCAVSIGACKILSQKMPMLNVEVIDENGILDSMLDRCLVDKLYVYRTVAGPRSDMPSYIWTMDRDSVKRI
ncbi:hypothetical protein E3N88_11444 [Mikania micrantha]|uniref:F-box domain-containing protein n=1 Tax=Mikania micrantha TaxID=192012 RepID=A0A5N6PDS0_9ASTR|nr:hypothetical protein E3N88_11444 [Mikania micrantha]